MKGTEGKNAGSLDKRQILYGLLVVVMVASMPFIVGYVLALQKLFGWREFFLVGLRIDGLMVFLVMLLIIISNALE